MMANANIEFHIRGEWRETEADGEACLSCGERIFLTQFTYFVRLQTRLERGRPIAAAKVCQSCYQAYQSLADDPHSS